MTNKINWKKIEPAAVWGGLAIVIIGLLIWFRFSGDCPFKVCSPTGTPQTNETVSTSTPWLTDYQTAVTKAVKESKLLLILFTGSDWCPGCIQLEQEVFSQPEFQQWAKEHLVLLLMDFPQQKPQTREQQKQNNMLVRRYRVEGYPTVILALPYGLELGRLGYQPGGPEKYVERLKELAKTRH